MWNNKAIIFLIPSTVQDQEEFDFLATFLDDHGGNSFESKDLFSIVDSSITKSSRESNVCQSQWRRIANGGNLDFSLSEAESSFSAGDDNLATAFSEWKDRVLLMTNDCDSRTPLLPRVSQAVHHLLDTCLVEGVVSTSIHLIWVVPKSGSFKISETLELYGCLLRLVEWFSGHVKIVCQNSSVSSKMEEWRDEIFAQVYTGPSVTVPLYSPAIWSGCLHFQEQKLNLKQSSDCVIFDGLSLCVDGKGIPPSIAAEFAQLQSIQQAICHLEVMQIVHRKNVPLMWITGHRLILSVENEHFYSDSVELMKRIQSWRGNYGLLLSLQTCSASAILSKRAHINWVDFVKNLSDGPVKVPDDYEHNGGIQFFAISPEPEVSGGNGKDVSLDLWLLRKPDEINCPSLQELAAVTNIPRVECTNLKDVELETVDLMNSLPVLSFTALDPDPVDNSVDHPMFSPFTKPVKPHGNSCAGSPSKCCELLILENREEKIASQKWKKSFTPDVFKDRIVCKTPEDMEDLKADQILALFNSDGTAVASKDGLPNVPAISNLDLIRKWCFPEGGETTLAKMTHWEASSGVYHGVQYCLDSETSWNARLVRIRQRYVCDDTGGVCAAVTTPRAKEIAKKKNNLRVLRSATKKKSAIERMSPKHVGSEQPSTLSTGQDSKKRQPFMDIAASRTNVPNEVNLVKIHRKRSLSVPADENSQHIIPSSVSFSSTSKISSKKVKSAPNPTSSSPRLRNPSKGQHGQKIGSKKKKVSKENESKEKAALKRSARHTKKLENIVIRTLQDNGVPKGHEAFKPCYKRLFSISKSFLKDLKTSRNLSEEMKNVTEMNVKQVVAFELKRTHPAAV